MKHQGLIIKSITAKEDSTGIYLAQLDLGGFQPCIMPAIKNNESFEVSEIKLIITSRFDSASDSMGICHLCPKETIELSSIPKIKIGMTVREFNI